MEPQLAGLAALAEVLGGTVVPADALEPGDLPIELDGAVVAGYREPTLHGALDRLIARVVREIGRDVRGLDRDQRRSVVHRLDDLGAFTLRKAVEDVASRLEVSRFTVYNDLNERHRPDARPDPEE